MATIGSIENCKKWTRFLAPLKMINRKENKETHDTHILGSEPCLSRDVALELDQLVQINTEEWRQHELDREAEMEEWRQQELDREVERNLKRNVSEAFGDDIDHDTEPTTPPKFPKTTSSDSAFSFTGALISVGKFTFTGVKTVVTFLAGSGKAKSATTPRRYKQRRKSSSPFFFFAGTLFSMGRLTFTGIRSVASFLVGSGKTQRRRTPAERSKQITIPPIAFVCKSEEPEPDTQDSTLMFSSDIPREFSGMVTSAASKTSPGYVKTNVQDDRSITLSKWDLLKFVKYVSFDRVEKLDISSENQSYSELNAFVGNLYQDARAIFGAEDLTRCIFKEAQSRIVIDMLIFKLSKFHDITVKLEEDVKFDFLPGGKLDYYFKNKDGLPIGCLEAKSPKTMDKNAFVQIVMELFMVQQMAEKRGVIVSDSPIFGILSDGIRFVLIQLRGDNLFLEHAGDVIKIRDINSERSCQRLLAALSELIVSSNHLIKRRV